MVYFAKIHDHYLNLHFRFQMFKICEIRLFSYVAGKLKLWKILAIRSQTITIERHKSLYLLRDLDLHFLFQMLNKGEIYKITKIYLFILVKVKASTNIWYV